MLQNAIRTVATLDGLYSFTVDETIIYFGSARLLVAEISPSYSWMIDGTTSHVVSYDVYLAAEVPEGQTVHYCTLPACQCIAIRDVSHCIAEDPLSLHE